MPRSTNNPATRRRHKKILKRAKGYRQGRSKLYQFAMQFTEKGLDYAWTDRRKRKRNFRSLWILRINAAVHRHGLTYRQFMCGLKNAGVILNRKVLAEMATDDPALFQQLTATAQKNIAGSPSVQ